ncbi:MAG: hypothetical protein AAGG51_23870 [Cyanobacteria bacterium P01_G01_bin.54]
MKLYFSPGIAALRSSRVGCSKAAAICQQETQHPSGRVLSAAFLAMGVGVERLIMV